MDIQITDLDVFYLNFEQLTGSSARSCKESHDEMPFDITIAQQNIPQVFIVGLRNDVFEVRFLLEFDMGQLPIFFPQEIQVGIDSAYSDVNRLCLEVFYQVKLVLLQFLRSNATVSLPKLSNGVEVQGDGVLRSVLKMQPAFECDLGHANNYNGRCTMDDLDNSAPLAQSSGAETQWNFGSNAWR